MGCCCARPAQDRLLEDDNIFSAFSKSPAAEAPTADPKQFEHPAQPIGVSGGTAAFYSLVFRPDRAPPGRGLRYWVGKDLAHAADELAFYERAKRLQAAEPDSWQLLRWMFEYGGVCEIPAQVGPRVEPRRMLLLRNLYDSAGKLRLLDVKIGSVTAVGGWQGKSHINAVKNRTIDQTTNSAVEGFRTEGFEQAPQSLGSLLDASVRDRLRGAGGLDKLTGGLIDVHLEFSAGKKGRRLALQKLRAAEFLSYWAQLPPEEPTLGSLTGQEVAVQSFARATKSLVALLSAASQVKVPQQWIGSSVALGFDTSIRPDRESAVPAPRVNIFDWGRSELTTQDMWEALSDKERRERAGHWREWVGGIMRLAFEMCRAYRRTYCPKGGRWVSIRIRVWSYKQDLVSSVTTGDSIGIAQIPLESAAELDVVLDPPDRHLLQHLTHAHQHAIRALGGLDRAAEAAFRRKKHGKMQVRLTIEGPGQFPQGSTLAERWVITVHRASNLPRLDIVGWCNPVVTVALADEDGAESTMQTSVRIGAERGAAVWDEQLEFCAAAEHARRAETLIPPGLLSRCPAERLEDWDLAAEGGPSSLHDQSVGSPRAKVDAALRAFGTAFCHAADPEAAGREPVPSVRKTKRGGARAALGMSISSESAVNAEVLADALRRLADAESRLEEETRRSRQLEGELRALKQQHSRAAEGAPCSGRGSCRAPAHDPPPHSRAGRGGWCEPPQRRRSDGSCRVLPPHAAAAPEALAAPPPSIGRGSGCGSVRQCSGRVGPDSGWPASAPPEEPCAEVNGDGPVPMLLTPPASGTAAAYSSAQWPTQQRGPVTLLT